MPLNVLDGVRPLDPIVARENWERAASVKDTSRPLSERLAIYKEIIDMEVGDTSIVRAKSIERSHDIKQLYLKFEGSNPTGTQKDRIAFAQCRDALRQGLQTLSVATCGNYGVATALAARLAGLQCIIFIPETYHTKRIREMEDLGAVIRRHPGTYEDSVRFSSEEALANAWYDANPGGQNTALQLEAYGQIAYEIVDQLGKTPHTVAAPVSNGTLLAGIYMGFKTLHAAGKIAHIPRMLAASSAYKNPIITSFRQGLDHCVDLRPEKIKESKINEPLINWHSFDGEEALTALRQSAGLAFHVSDEKMRQQTKWLREKEGLQVLPASTAGLVGLLRQHQDAPLAEDTYVAVLTARF